MIIREITGNKERYNFYMYETIYGLDHSKTANTYSKQ